MPESEATAPEAEAPETSETPTPEAPPAKTFDAAYVAKLRQESAGYRTRASDVQAQLDAASTALSEATEKASRTEAAELQIAKLTVALEKGLPAHLIPRLVGTTAEELAADADVLVAAINPAPAAPLGHGPQGSVEQPAQKADVNAAFRRLARK